MGDRAFSFSQDATEQLERRLVRISNLAKALFEIGESMSDHMLPSDVAISAAIALSKQRAYISVVAAEQVQLGRALAAEVSGFSSQMLAGDHTELDITMRTFSAGIKAVEENREMMVCFNRRAHRHFRIHYKFCVLERNSTIGI
jgi:hypothetical protein